MPLIQCPATNVSGCETVREMTIASAGSNVSEIEAAAVKQYGELLREAEQLVGQKIHPMVIIAGGASLVDVKVIKNDTKIIKINQLSKH